ncbi:MAG: GrpB family protein [Dysgonomonas sp.]|nr:GrpB family protein [Dysgonomonas sp.]
MNKSLNDLSNEELWKLFPIIISEHQPKWQQLYSEEKEKLCLSIGSNNITRINHIGSTAIPKLLAKPTIDILIEIKKNADLESLIKNIESAGYIFAPQPKNPPPHMMFMKGYTIEGFKGQAFHIHVRYPGDWDELYFRDYLLSHPQVADKYGELKLKLKEEHEFNRDAYTYAKTEFVKSITRQAREEIDHRYKIEEQ